MHQRLPSKHTRYEIRSGGIEDDIIRFLAGFAKSARYYNLDYLVAGSATAFTDPIAEWFSTTGADILRKHYSNKRRHKDAASAAHLEALLGPQAYVRHTAEDGSPMTTMESAALQTSRNMIIQKYGTFYCAKIARVLYMILFDLVHEAHSAGIDVPFLYELFFPFMNDDDYLLSRRTFPPRGQ